MIDRYGLLGMPHYVLGFKEGYDIHIGSGIGLCMGQQQVQSQITLPTMRVVCAAVEKSMQSLGLSDPPWPFACYAALYHSTGNATICVDFNSQKDRPCLDWPVSPRHSAAVVQTPGLLLARFPVELMV